MDELTGFEYLKVKTDGFETVSTKLQDECEEDCSVFLTDFNEMPKVNSGINKSFL